MKQKSLQVIQGVLWYVELILNIDSMSGNNEKSLYKYASCSSLDVTSFVFFYFRSNWPFCISRQAWRYRDFV